MIGCTTMERHIVPTSLRSPLERLASTPFTPQFLDVAVSDIGAISPECQFLYLNIGDSLQVSAEVWAAILHQMHKHSHAILYRLDFKLDPGFSDYRGYQELALYPLSTIEKETPTYVAFTPPMEEDEGDYWMDVSTYSLRPVVTSGA